MRPRQQVSRAAIELVKRFEGYRRQAARLPDGRWTIGYGHTKSARAGAEVSEADAEALLRYDLMGVAEAVEGQVFAALSQNQFDALCAFAFSVGLDAFRGSEVLKRVNEGAFIQAAFALELWRRAEFEGESLVIDALVRRRAAEKLLFLTPLGEAWPPAPSAVLRPTLDLEARDTAPAAEPTAVIASLQGETVQLARPASEPAEAAFDSPVAAAAEALSERLESLFPEPGEPTEAVVTPEEAKVPADVAVEADEVAANALQAVEATETAEAAPEAEPAEPAEDVEGPMPRILIDDTAPYEFIASPVLPSSNEPEGGPFIIAVLIVLGLAFFAGGVFWALNAQPGVEGGVFTPLLVGWLAGVAGVGFIAAAVFMLLQRLGGVAEERGRKA